MVARNDTARELAETSGSPNEFAAHHTRLRKLTSKQVRKGRLMSHLLLALVALLCMFPFYWLIVMASSRTSDIYTSPPRLVPGARFFHNFENVLDGTQFSRAFLNSLWLAAVITVLQLFLASLAGYVFAKRSFPHRDGLFAVLLVTLMVPTGVALVPSYQIYAKLGWINTFYPLIVPGAVTAFGVFWMRQAAQAAISSELIDAAEIDGAGFVRVYWHVALPAMRATLVAFGVFQVMWAWNDYLWPLLVLGKQSEYTLTVALQQLKGSYGTVDYSVVMAGTLVATVPLVILFLALRKRILESVGAGALKG